MLSGGGIAAVSALFAAVAANAVSGFAQQKVYGLPAQPPENYSGNANPGTSMPANERVLLQANPTAPGVAQGIDLGPTAVSGSSRRSGRRAR